MTPHETRANIPTSSPESAEGGRALLRLGWMVGGTLTMLIAWFTIVATPAWTFGLRDAAFWLGAFASLTLRYLDINRFGGLTSGGEPATITDFRRYTVTVILIAAVGWALAQSVHI